VRRVFAAVFAQQLARLNPPLRRLSALIFPAVYRS
jgi:hypothetical protein